MRELTLLEQIGSLLHSAITKAQQERANKLLGMVFDWHQIHQDEIWLHLEGMKQKCYEINVGAKQWAEGTVKKGGDA